MAVSPPMRRGTMARGCPPVAQQGQMDNKKVARSTEHPEPDIIGRSLEGGRDALAAASRFEGCVDGGTG